MTTPPQVATPDTPAPVPSLPDGVRNSLHSIPELQRQAKEAARAVRKFARKNPAAMCTFEDGKRYACVELWQFLGACFGHTPLITSTQELRDDAGTTTGFLAVAHIRNPQGQIVSGAEAVCMFSESEWKEKAAFQLRSMASTRAISKAFRNVFAWVMVMAGFCSTPAEEMMQGGLQHFDQVNTGRKCHECGNQLSDKRWHSTRRKYGKALCLPCEKSHNDRAGEQITNVVNNPRFVEQSVEAIRQKKAAQGQPIVDALDAGKEEIG